MLIDTSFLVLFRFAFCGYPYPLSLIAPGFVESRLSEQLIQADTVFPGLYHGLMLFVTVIFAPLTEEFIFRGILLQRWSVKWGLPTGIIASAILFGALHVSNPIGLTMFGLMMALLYVRTHSLWVPILAHGLNNLLSVLPALLLPAAKSATLDLQEFQQTWWVGLLFLAISAPMLGPFIYRNWPKLGDPPPYFVNAHRHF